MNYSIIIRLISTILATMALAFAASMGVALYMGEDANINSWLFCIAITSVLALISFVGSRGGNHQMFKKEALVVIALCWICACLMGSLPYYLILDCSLTDAIFESTSGLTTTGASVFNNLDEFPSGLMFWRCLSQWVGGLGVVVFFVAILSFLGAGGKILYTHESTAKSKDLESSTVKSGVTNIFLLYLLISVICMVAYHVAGMSWYDALCHMFTTVATGGFSTHTESFAYFNNPAIEWICITFMLIGATSFLVILRLTKFKWKKDYKKFTEVYFFYFIAAVSIVVLSCELIGHDEDYLHDWVNTVRTATFQVVSIMTTSGFASTDTNEWIPFAHVLLMALMITGGCTGSTAGGMKVSRIIIALKICIVHIEKVFRTRVVRSIHMNNQILDDNAIESNMHYVMMVGGICFLCFPIIAFSEPMMSVEGVVSTTLAMVFNIGPGFAEVGVANNYAFMHDHTKLFLSLVMIMGRLEFYAILVLFVPSLWKKFS